MIVLYNCCIPRFALNIETKKLDWGKKYLSSSKFLRIEWRGSKEFEKSLRHVKKELVCSKMDVFDIIISMVLKIKYVQQEN